MNRTNLKDLSAAAMDAVWSAQNGALLPAYQAGKLGLVIFQFHLGFTPTDENRRHVMWCRERLDSRYTMAVEFRSRNWGADTALLMWMRQAGVVLIAADELLHETMQKDREQRGLPPGQARKVMPILLEVTNPQHVYVRVHRRQGHQRILSAHEHQVGCLIWFL
jgi:uncharacterized protein YecE (DUF72 family)